jgi:3-dehydro-L-gulonate 2-dehydrogenase
METYKNEGKRLPYSGGFNKEGELTDDPAEILETWRALPIGYWKGSGMSLLLDILATILSGGLSTHEIKDCNSEYSLSQVYIAINISSLKNFPSIASSVQAIINDLKSSKTENEIEKVRYPGENVVVIRNENLKNGIPVNSEIWDRILKL